MIELTNSGLPLYLNEENNKMALSAPLVYDGFGAKYVKGMMGLLADEENVNAAEAYYDVYRGIRFPEDTEALADNEYRYDITIIMDGLVNGECKKTSGHYHGYNQKRTNTYGEVYEVIKGTALYVLQKADNFDTNPDGVLIKDLIFATVKEGQTIIIPPNYGHCSINIGEGPLVFSNLAYVPCPVKYDSVKYYHGMSFYVMKDAGKIYLKTNERYKNVPAPKYATVIENPAFGIKFGRPVYQSYFDNPNAFDYLKNPDPYVDEIMNMLVYKNELIQGV